MTGAAHWCAGWIVGGVLTGDPALAFAAGLVALAPDIDHPQSTISRRAPGSWLLRLILTHRGFTHSLAALAIAGAAGSALVPASWWLLIVAALASHIVCDMMTPAGVPLLWPMPRRYRLLPRAAGPLVPALEALLAVGAVVMFYQLLT